MAGKCLPALDLFAMIIKKMRDDLKRELPAVMDEDIEKDIIYVIIVPALLQERREMNLITKAAIKVLIFICSIYCI